MTPLPRWPFVLTGIVVLGIVAVVLWIVFVPQPDVWTDDAYVSVHYASVSPRVAGQVTSVQVEDNQIVKAGQVTVTLDPADFQTAVAGAEAAIARDTAQVTNASADVTRQPPLIGQQEAAVASAEAKLVFSRSDSRRYRTLAATGAGTAQEHQQADTTTRQAEASLHGAQAGLEALKLQMRVLQASVSSSQAAVKADQAKLAQAHLNLGYTTIVVPLDGMVGNRSVQVGDYVSPGTTLLTVVPLDRVYIEANYREEALRHVRSGQPATIHVDAYGFNLRGIVDSVPPATGTTFSPIPPSNATGNFTKIVQRLPVKIVLSPNQPLARLLRVGFSVETTIHTGFEDVVGEQDRQSAPVTAH